MDNDRRLRRCQVRTARIYENIGFRYSFCGGQLGEIFSLSLDSVYDSHSGVYAAVFVNEIPARQYKRILAYQTIKNKEIVVWIFDKEKKNDSGKYATYRISGSKLIEFPASLPIEKVLEAPKNGGAGSKK